MATNGSFSLSEQYKAPTSEYAAGSEAANEQTTAASHNHDLPKDEVGWYFVEQYYTTLNKSPEKLHLFYGKRSQFVYGMEAEVANVAVGRSAIQEKIKELDFQQCKVRITNVDSLPSLDNIVIQVIGEISNKGSEEPKKFCQTFVLAKQPSGYFVLNDIWRYINDEEDEATPEDVAKEEPQPESTAAVPAASETAPVPEEVKAEVAKDEASPTLDPDAVDQKLEEVAKEEPKEPEIQETPTEPAKEPAKEPATKPEPSEAEQVAEAAACDVEKEAPKEAEQPKEPAPTPVAPAKAPAPAAVEPEKPAIPAKPLTWASRLAAATGPPKPVVPLPKTATPPAASQPRAPAPAAKPAAAATAPAVQRSEPAPSQEQETAPSQPAGGEWQTAGADSKRQRPQSMVGEKEGTMAYVKYVTDKVQETDLRATLSSYGQLTYFDVNRVKNCAFVEFATPEGYKAAVNANPHVVNGENVIVEQRRPKSTAYGGAQYVANRGTSSGRGGRGGYDGGRSGSQSGPRGQYGGAQSRGRGGGGPRGKSSVQTS